MVVGKMLWKEEKSQLIPELCQQGLVSQGWLRQERRCVNQNVKR